MANISIFALGGQDESGKNTYVVEYENDIFVFNVGNKVPINNRNGIDALVANWDYLIRNKKKIKGVFITHAHDETFAALPWLIMDVKGLNVYSSAFTNTVIKNRVEKYKLGHTDFKIQVIDKPTKFGNLEIVPYEVAASIPGALAYKLKTPDGDIIFQSNYVDAELGPFGKTNIEEIKKGSDNVLALMTDSRIAHYHGSSKDHCSVTGHVQKIFDAAGAKSRIIVGAYDEEMYSLYEVIKIATKQNRPIVAYGRTFDFLYAEMVKRYKVDFKPEFIDYRMMQKVDNAVILVTGTWSRLYQRLTRIANNQDVFLKFKGDDHFIMIAPPISGLEVEASVAMDDIAKITANITDINEKYFYNLRPAEDDVFKAVKTIKPKYFLPISAMYRYMMVASDQAIKAGVTKDRNILLHNGKIAKFVNGKLESQNRTVDAYGDVIIDGFGAGDISYEVIRERETLAAGGVVSITVMVDRRTKMPYEKMNIQIAGVVTKSELQEMQDLVKGVVLEKIAVAERWDYREIQNTIRKRVRKVISKKIDKEPLVVIAILEV